MISEIPNDPEMADLIERASTGDEQAMATLFERCRPRLRRMISLRMSHKLRGRLDASDVLQDAYLDLARRLPEYCEKSNLPFFLWLRLITGQCLTDQHRKHLGAAKRSAELEVSIYRRPAGIPEASGVQLASELIDRFTTVGAKAMRSEMQIMLQDALNTMDPDDLEVITLRHFEELSNNETAAVLGIAPPAASKRYVRALDKLRVILQRVPGLVPEV